MTSVLIHSYLLLIIGLIEFALAVYFAVTNSGDKTRRFFSIFVFGVAMWVLSVGIANLIHLSSHALQLQSIELVIMRFAFWGPIIALSSLLIVSWLFPFPLYKFEAPMKVVFLFPIILFGCLIMFTGTVISGIVVPSPTHYETTQYGSAYPYFVLFVLVYYLWSLFSLLQKKKIAAGAQKEVLSKFTLGIAGSGIIGVFTNALIPLLFNNQSLWYLGPEASIIWLGITSYVLVRK